VALLPAILAVTSCDKMPLVAPTGSVITLYANSSVMAAHGTIEVTATVIEQGSGASGGTGGATAAAGQPVHNGTVITFTTTIGSFDLKEARTHNGQVNVRLIGNGQSGTASVFAFSGGAKSAELKIAVGTAAVDHLVVTADPQILPSSGGTTQLSARVEDVSGNPTPDIPVTFALTSGAGTIVPATAMTNSAGVAQALLTATQKVEVTASAGAKTGKVAIDIMARTGVSISAPTTAPTAGTPANFTVSVTSAANVRDVTVTWGDGTSTSVGAISGSTVVAHVYSRDGTYTVTATATDASGNRESVSTSVTVLQASPVTVTVTASPTLPTTGQTVTFTATATAPAGSSVLRLDWNFGDGTGTTTTGSTVSHVYSVSGAQTVTVTAVATNGATGTGQTIVTVTAQTPISVTLTPSSTSPAIGQTVLFTATTGTLPSGAVITEYRWNFGDGTGTSPPHPTGNTITHVYNAIGAKDITVTVVLSNGATGTGLTTVIVSNPPPVSVQLQASPSTATVNVTPVTLTAIVGTVPAGFTILNYEFEYGDGTPNSLITSATAPPHTYTVLGVKTARVTVRLTNNVTGDIITAINQVTVNVVP
jgi:PKD repeat protein